MVGLMCVFAVMIGPIYCQSVEPNIVLVTLDGFRWQELFRGADPSLSQNEVSRKDLMPFFWTEIVANGQILGNRDFNNKINCDNPHWFSYPGYSEMLTGFVDRRVKSNDRIENPNMTVFEFISKSPGYENQAAVFGT